MDVVDAPSAVHSLWNAGPAVVQKPLKVTEAQVRPAFRSLLDHEGFADPLDGFAIRGFAGLVYDEPAFQYLLDVERRRAEGARRPFLLMLIACGDGKTGLASRAVRPEKVFPVVGRCVRETDFVGWYRQGSVVGATLTQDGKRTPRASQIVRERLVKALGSDLPADLVSQLRLRLYEVQGDDQLRID